MPLLDDPWLPAADSSGRIAAVRPAATIAVARYDGAGSFLALPNVECLSISRREGTDPGHATFRYDLSSPLDGAPTSIEEALGTGFVGTYAVNTGDRLVVSAGRPDGVSEYLFDGYAVDFGMSLDPDTEEVHIGAVGVAWRAWDDAIGGAILRDADDPKAIKDTRTDVPAHFNPQGVPNCIPNGYMAGSRSNGVDSRYPTFLDPAVVRSPDVRTYWTLPKAVRYILYNANPAQTYVANPSGDALDALLVSPSAGGDQSNPLVCPDTPITGRDWPGTVHRLLGDRGFSMRFALGTDDGGLPRTSLQVAGSQAGTVKPLYLAARGTAFDPGLFNVSGSSLHREVADVVNSWKVKGGLDRWEASFILAPGFPMTSSDASLATVKTFDRGDPSYIAANRDKYRLYVFDETGEGHYAMGSTTKVTSVVSLDGLFGKDKYAKRRRRPLGDLISVDTKGQPFKARLAISTDYAGSRPALWDGTGTWQQVTAATWRLLPDRLGIEITDTNPNSWNIASVLGGTVFPSGVILGVERQATSGSNNFFLRLTCVVEADLALTQTAGPRGGSPLPQTVNRVIDASDRYRVDRVDYPSEFNATSNQDRIVRDDRPAALAEAQAVRAGTESGVLSGPVTIPRLTTYYAIGDRIGSIEGRGLGFRTDQGAGDPVYPVVVGVTYHLGPESQSTTLELSDAGTSRKKYMRQGGRPLKDARGRPRFNRRGG